MTAIAKDFDEDEVLASSIGGLVLCAPKGTAAPADALVDWPTGWESVGLIDDNGIKTTYKKDQTEHFAWNVRGTVKRVPKSANYDIDFTVMQTSDLTHKLFFGSAPVALSTSGHSRTDINALSDLTEYAWGLEFVYTDGSQERHIIPRGVVTSIGAQSYSEKDLKVFQMTVGAQISPGVSYLAYIMSNSAGIVAA